MVGWGTIRNRLSRAAHWLALAAMLVQFVASYGHLHPEDFDAVHHGHGAPVLAEHHGPSRAIGNAADQDIDCQICASMAMLGSSALPEGVHVIPPLLRHVVVAADIKPLWLTPPRHLLFDTRGPPLV
jgi:hypothetical protein